jgi:serine O-acetyltransferase
MCRGSVWLGRVLGMIQSKKDYKYYLQQDRKALGIPEIQSITFLMKEFFFPNHIWTFQKTLRKLEYLTNVNRGVILNFIKIITKIKFRNLSLKLGFSIPINVFGPGLSIAHYGTIVVNGNVKIGNNCRLHTSVNIGASAGNPEAPQLGDNVYIRPGAILFGKIYIANNVTIAANATVNKDYKEEGVVLAGTPAKIVKRDFPVWWKNNQINLE